MQLDDFGIKDAINIVLYVCCCFSSVVLFIFILTCFSITEVDEITLAKNNWTNNLYYHSSWAEPGRHFTGPQISLIKFRKTRILIDFSEDVERGDAGGAKMECWSKEGTNIYLDISFYIRLNKDKIEAFYKAFGEKYMDYVVRISYVAIKETTIKFPTVSFFTQRNIIQTEVFNAIQSKYDTAFFGALKIEEIQLRKISYDEGFSVALINKLVELQKKRVYENGAVLQSTTVETAKQVADVQNEIDLVLAQGTTEAIVKDADLQSSAFKDLVIKQNEIYKKMETDLSLTVAATLKQYMYLTELKLAGSNLGNVRFVDNNAKKYLNV